MAKNRTRGNRPALAGQAAPKRRKGPVRMPWKYCTETQYYKGTPLTLIVYDEEHFKALKAKRFMLGTSGGQNIWIPNACLDGTGRILPTANIDNIIRQAIRQNKFKYAGIDIDPVTCQARPGCMPVLPAVDTSGSIG